MSEEEREYLFLADDFLDRESLQEHLDRLGLYSTDLVDALVEEIAQDDVCCLCHKLVEFYVAPGDSCEGRFCHEAIDAWLDESSDFEDEELLEFAEKFYDRFNALGKEAVYRWGKQYESIQS